MLHSLVSGELQLDSKLDLCEKLIKKFISKVMNCLLWGGGHDFLSIFVQMVPTFLELDKKYYGQKWTKMDNNGQKWTKNKHLF